MQKPIGSRQARYKLWETTQMEKVICVRNHLKNFIMIAVLATILLYFGYIYFIFREKLFFSVLRRLCGGRTRSAAFHACLNSLK